MEEEGEGSNIIMHNIIMKNMIWIYGVGRKGKRVFRALKSLNLNVKGFLVSSMMGNIDNYNGVGVTEFSATELTGDEIIIITVDGTARKEVVSLLESNNAKYVIWTNKLLCSLWKSVKYKFINRSRCCKSLCIVLCGYKEYLWGNVFKRLKDNLPEDVEVCLCSSGKYLEELDIISQKNQWSYLSTDLNSVSLIQNLCISLHESAEWIYKMDEDMFVTSRVFENLMNAGEDLLHSDKYDLGMVSPIIPLNGNSYRLVLEKYNLLKLYEKNFGKAFVGGNPDREIEKNPEVAKFMWGAMPLLDDIARDASGDSGYYVCVSRLSIGFVLFKRHLWEEMQGFIVYGNTDLGVDEEDINAFCINNSKVIIIAKNAVVGHFGFGKQTEAMKLYFYKYGERF